MKNYVFIFVLLISSIAKADCGASGLNFYPTTYTVSTNSHFYIEGYYNDQEFVRDIGSAYNVKLVSENESIALEKVDLYEGMYHLTIVSLKPSKNLSKEVSYTLKIYDKNGEEALKPTRYDGNTCDWLPVMYKASKKPDTVTPQLLEAPKFDQSTFTPFGCGPAMYANFKCKIEDDSELMILVKLKNLESNEINTYPVLLRGGIIQIGHGMCSGEFAFKKNVEYKASFSMTDMSGNSAGNWTKWMDLTNPNDIGFNN